MRKKTVKWLFMDVDGTLTDGKIYMSAGGECMKAFHCRDGLGIVGLLPDKGIIPVIITGRKSQILENRCRELGIEQVHQGIKDKKGLMCSILKSYGAEPGEAAYIGDDLNDIECMKFIRECGGIVGCPFDAADEVKALSHYISGRDGGYGAVREFIEWL